MGTRAFKREVELFRRHGGGLRVSEALRLGINRKTLYAMRDAVTRGAVPARVLANQYRNKERNIKSVPLPTTTSVASSLFGIANQTRSRQIVDMTSASNCLAIFVGISSVLGCEADEPVTAEAVRRIPVLSQGASPTVAVVSQGVSTTVVFTDSENLNRAYDVLATKHAAGFYWLAIELQGANVNQAYSPKGLTLDLSDVASKVTFSQSYQDICNPAKADFSPCWLFESYTAGADRLTGAIQLQIGEASAISSFEVMWEGLTDRFGDPIQWHKHSTSGRAAGATQVAK